MQLDFKFKAINNKKYEIDSIWNNIVYVKTLAIEQLLGFYYLVLYKSYFEVKIS